MIPLYSLWFILSIVILALFAGLDSAFGMEKSISIVDAAFLSFVIIWCYRKGFEDKRGGGQ